MPYPLVLPQSTVALAGKVSRSSRHPGLQLDKFSQVGDQADQKAALEKVLETSGDASLLKALQQRRQRLRSALLGSVEWQCQTTGPLTLHLSRASSMENAGICLHPLYGFVYLPGSGLKGMARSYAETIWLPTQSDQAVAWSLIEDVFGWAPNRDRQQQLSDPKHPAQPRYEQNEALNNPEITTHTGTVIFHDAWPQTWPRLMLDIVNNHHGDYYSAKADDVVHAPGDWESPVPVYFLAIGTGEVFTFTVSKRRDNVPGHLLVLSRQWVTGALCYLGAGAKTAAGYGSFALLADADTTLVATTRQDWQTALEATMHAEFTSTLELVTPAFLAGASQRQEDCDLRSATLRGALRWWWRSLHAGQVDVPTLRRLEAAIWGSTENGGAIRVTVERVGTVTPEIYDYKNGYYPKLEFQQAHNLNRSPNNKTTQGLFYVSYGMDEVSGGTRKQRWYMPPGARWIVRITAHQGIYEERNKLGEVVQKQYIAATDLCNQAKAALWLLCHFGGLGSKARKGFGSFTTQENLSDMTLDTCKEIAQQFRKVCGTLERPQNSPESAALEYILQYEVTTPWKDCWFVLDQLGFSAQAFAQAYKHNPIKQALGLPRKIHGPLPYSLPNQTMWQLPIVLSGFQGDRHTSPVHYHIAYEADGTLLIRVAAFPAKYLPDWHTSSTFLAGLIAHHTTELSRRIKAYASQGQKSASRADGGTSGMTLRPPHGTVKRSSGSAVTVTIVAKRPKGGYDVQEANKPRGALTIGQEPALPPQIGEQVQVLIHNDDPRNPQYRWGTPSPNAGKDPGSPKGSQRGGLQKRR